MNELPSECKLKAWCSIVSEKLEAQTGISGPFIKDLSQTIIKFQQDRTNCATAIADCRLRNQNMARLRMLPPSSSKAE